MKERNKASYDRVVLRGILVGGLGACVLLALSACNQIVGITEPTLVEGTGGFGGEGGVSATSSSTGSSSGSTSSGGGGGTTSGSSSSSSGSMPCQNSGDCPNDTACINWSCTNSACVAMFRAQGTAANDPTNGDCKTDVCDGMGATMTVADNNDVPPDDGNPCTTAMCNNGLPVNTSAPVGTMCPGGTCNASGDCSSCSNGMMDGNETGVDCGGSACKKCNGDACAAGADCKSTFCTDAVCCDVSCTGTCKSCNINGSAGTCSNILLDSTDSAPACNGTNVCDGAGACKLKTGEACTNNAECASGFCTGNPKKCAA